MKSKPVLFIALLLLSTLACGLPSAAPAEPTINALPPTPDLPFTSDTSPAPAATDAPPASPFNGTWSGSDSDDGSFITLTLSQSGNSLTGTFADTFSGDVKPGYTGSGSGTVDSATTAQITFDMVRGDGKSASATFSLTLSNNNNTITLGCDVGCPITLQK